MLRTCLSAAAPLAFALTTACAGDGGPSGSSTNPAPTISSIAPDTVARGAAEATVTLRGGGFTPQTVGRIGGADRQTQVVSGTELRVRLSAADLATGHIVPVTAYTPAPGGGESGPFSLVIANPVPTFGTVSVATLEARTAATVTLTGTNFVPETTVWSTGGTLQSAYVSPTELRVALSAQDLAQPGLLILYISNPPPGGGSTNATNIQVQNPAPTLTAVAPISVGTRSPGTVTLTGTKFVPGAFAYVGNEPRLPTLTSATQMQIALTPLDVAVSGTLSFRVTNPGPGGGFSNTVTMDVIAPTPVITSLLDPSITIGSSHSGLLAVNGTGFLVNSVIRLDGEPRPTSGNDAGTQVYTQLTANDLLVPHTITVTVSTPAPGGGVSNAVYFQVLGPAGAVTTRALPAPPRR